MAADCDLEEVDPLAGWVLRVQLGDLTAFESLYGATRQQVHRTLHKLVGPSPDVEDLVQQVYLQLLSAVRAFRGTARFSTFLHRVCANVALMHLRSKRRRPEEPWADVPEGPAPESADPEHSAQVRQAVGLMERALDQMAPKKRIVFVYHELLGLLPEEIAEAVDTSPNTVRSRLHHARKEFTALIAKMTREEAKWVIAQIGGLHGA
jgi:RNA polymerase sigma-70 factor (ECF subfamily)